jgi:NAD(P)-dependent dehydrogenase (short-subunit alcohol dehydrogenase family)
MNQVVVITGASSGIGRATALEFAKRGACLVLGSRHEGTAASLMKDLGEGRAVFKQTDVTVSDAWTPSRGPNLTAA